MYNTCTDTAKAGECGTRERMWHKRTQSGEDGVKWSPEYEIFNPSRKPKVKHNNSKQTQATKQENKNPKNQEQISHIQEKDSGTQSQSGKKHTAGRV